MNQDQNAGLSEFNGELKLKGFKVYQIDSENNSGHTYSRKDFYKINITTGKFIFHYANRSVEADKTFLFFANPNIPYSCERVSVKFSGYTCLFTESFIKSAERSESLQQSPLFKFGGTPVLKLDKEQEKFVVSLFKRMIAEQKMIMHLKEN